MVRDGPGGWVIANGVVSVGLDNVKHARGNARGCLGLIDKVFRMEEDA